MVRESHPPLFRLIPYLKKAEALAMKDISDLEHGQAPAKKKCYTRLTQTLNKIVDQFNPEDPVKTLKKISDIVKMGDALDMPPEEEHLLN